MKVGNYSDTKKFNPFFWSNHNTVGHNQFNLSSGRSKRVSERRPPNSEILNSDDLICKSAAMSSRVDGSLRDNTSKGQADQGPMDHYFNMSSYIFRNLQMKGFKLTSDLMCHPLYNGRSRFFTEDHSK